jgi:hypothetical protein
LLRTGVSRSSTSEDSHFRKKQAQEFETPEARRVKLIVALDLRETCVDRSWTLGERIPGEREGRKGGRSQPSVKRHHLRSQDRWSCLIAGTESDRTLKILERAAIETTVFPKGYVETGSELRGEKWCGLKPLLATPQSRAYVRAQPEVICEGKDLARGASVCYLNSSKRPGKSPAGLTEPAL